MQTTNPSRPRDVVRLNSHGFIGEMHTVFSHRDEEGWSLSQLHKQDRLCVSPSGSHVALVERTGSTREEVVHSGIRERFIFFCPDDEEASTRIITVGEDSVLVWGIVDGYPAGVWFLTPRLCRFLYPMSRLSGFFGNDCRVPVGESKLYPGSTVVGMPWGLWPVRPGSKVEVSGARLCVLEPFVEGLFAYQVLAHGAERFTQVQKDEALRVLPWGGGIALVSRSRERSAVREIGTPVSNRPVVSLVAGEVVEAWGSPCKARNMHALLTRSCEASDIVTQALYINDRLVQEGEFTLRRKDLHWSPRGVSFAAFVRYGTYGKIVSPREEIVLPQTESCKEALVSDSGRLRAAIVNDGEKDRVLVPGGRIGTRVSMAWNLHQGVDGSVVWNTVHNDTVLRWVDRTHQNAVASC